MKKIEVLRISVLVVLTILFLYLQKAILDTSGDRNVANVGILFFFIITCFVYDRFWKWFKVEHKIHCIAYGIFIVANFILAMIFYGSRGVLLLTLVPILASSLSLIDLIFKPIEKFLKKWL